MSYANKMNIPFVIVIGEDEISAGKIQVKNMESGDNTEFNIDDYNAIMNFIKQ